MTIKQTITFNASSDRLYSALTSSVEFGKVTGADAEISEDEGGAFSCFGGYPDGGEEHLEGGWHKMYWEPLKNYFS